MIEEKTYETRRRVNKYDRVRTLLKPVSADKHQPYGLKEIEVFNEDLADHLNKYRFQIHEDIKKRMLRFLTQELNKVKIIEGVSIAEYLVLLLRYNYLARMRADFAFNLESVKKSIITHSSLHQSILGLEPWANFNNPFGTLLSYKSDETGKIEEWSRGFDAIAILRPNSRTISTSPDLSEEEETYSSIHRRERSLSSFERLQLTDLHEKYEFDINRQSNADYQKQRSLILAEDRVWVPEVVAGTLKRLKAYRDKL